MPDISGAEPGDLVGVEPQFYIEWEKLPFPGTWDELEAGVTRWLDAAWGPDWRCSHCHNRYWSLLEAVGLDSTSWPIEDGSNYGSYPMAPVICTRCRQVNFILLLTIFENPAEEHQPPSTAERDA